MLIAMAGMKKLSSMSKAVEEVARMHVSFIKISRQKAVKNVEEIRKEIAGSVHIMIGRVILKIKT